jgi:hypothetical protein
MDVGLCFGVSIIKSYLLCWRSWLGGRHHVLENLTLADADPDPRLKFQMIDSESGWGAHASPNRQGRSTQIHSNVQ